MDKKDINQNLRWLVMPDYIYSDERLTDVSRRVYCFIHTFKGQFFFFSNKHMAKMFHCSEQSISNSIQQLQELKYINTQYEPKPSGGKTRLVIDLYSDNNSAYSRVSKSEAPTITAVIDNDINDNNLMEKNSSNKKNDTELNEILQSRHKRKDKKNSNGFYKPRFEKQEQTIVKKNLNPLEDEEIKEIAIDLEIEFEDAKIVYQQVMLKVDSGDTNRINSVEQTLRSWILNGLQKKTINKRQKFPVIPRY